MSDFILCYNNKLSTIKKSFNQSTCCFYSQNMPRLLPMQVSDCFNGLWWDSAIRYTKTVPTCLWSFSFLSCIWFKSLYFGWLVPSDTRRPLLESITCLLAPSIWWSTEFSQDEGWLAVFGEEIWLTWNLQTQR